MDILEVINNILTTDLINEDLQYCLVNETKLPYTIFGKPARSNHNEDFVSMEKLVTSDQLDKYNGLGISIQASKISAVDVDKCFTKPFDLSTADERAKAILDFFKDKTYCEFSFSGKGLRILLKNTLINDYSKKYYIKNSKNGIEFYQPSNSNRYVTVTGRAIYNNKINNLDDSIIEFLDLYMRRKEISKNVTSKPKTTMSIDKALKKIKFLYYTNNFFQDLWFGKAPGSNSNESELDYQLLEYLYENITEDKELLRQLFEESPYYKSKDKKHIYKWKYNDFRYFNYMFDRL